MPGIPFHGELDDLVRWDGDPEPGIGFEKVSNFYDDPKDAPPTIVAEVTYVFGQDREENVGRDQSGSTNDADYTAVEETDDSSVSNSDSGEHHYTDRIVHPWIPVAGAHGDLLPEEAGEARQGTGQEAKLRSGSRCSEPRPFQSRSSFSGN
ncbi:uncharacterized protein LOC117218068 isoform X2 [Megalopta genalis]|uniref:uncharacterized protein LOC117218068 isoform X2 n=1 Tax=Megalopta genalis TaxID=115081 RepID=UPI003FD3DD4C